MARRRLTDLYVTGRELTIDDGRGDPVTVWLQKLSDVDHSTALRRASAKRAVALMWRNDPECEEYQAAYADIHDFGDRAGLIDLILREERARRMMSAEARLGAEDEWAEDGYLEGLREAWHQGLKDTYAQDPDEPEAARVFKELARFTDTVRREVEDEMAAAAADWDAKPDDVLRAEATKQFLEQRATNAFLDEYQRCELWLATRKPEKHTDYYFESREEIDQLQPDTLAALRNAYAELVVEPSEGKGSPAAPSSSPSSDRPERVLTQQPSGPTAAGP